jgi:hypothetical protein
LRRTILPLPVALKRFAAALRVLSFGMDGCYLDTSSNGITFLMLYASGICDDDELLTEYHFDYQKAKPNRFAAHSGKQLLKVVVLDDVIVKKRLIDRSICVYERAQRVKKNNYGLKLGYGFVQRNMLKTLWATVRQGKRVVV